MAYEFTDDMREISGFGGGYEAECRRMLRAALEWHDAHPYAIPLFGPFLRPENDAARELEAAILKAGPGCTGAMFGAALVHARSVREMGWEAYCEKMRQLKREADESGETAENERINAVVQKFVEEATGGGGGGDGTREGSGQPGGK